MLRKLPFSERILGKARDPRQEEEERATENDGETELRAFGTSSLPFGWEIAVSRSTGEQYYVNSATGESTFTLPDFTNGQKLQQYGPSLSLSLSLRSLNLEILISASLS